MDLSFSDPNNLLKATRFPPKFMTTSLSKLDKASEAFDDAWQ